MSILRRWEHRRLSIVWVMLTTARGGSRRDLRKHLWELERRIKKKYGHESLEHAVIDTTEGQGVLHLLWAAEGSLYVDQAWLSAEWGKIHGATYVWIARYRKGTAGRLSRYMVSQYMAGQEGAGVRISWSWKTTFTVPIKAVWRLFKREGQWTSPRLMIEDWGRFLCDETVSVGGYLLSLRTWGAVRLLIGYERSGGGWAYSAG